MGYTIDIDTGGTFTDCFLHRDGTVRTVKVPTTPHDLTVCLLEGIRAGARAFGVTVEDLLYGTDIIRFSNTIGTNTIIQRDGTRIGLLVSRGAEMLAPTCDASGRPPLVAPDMVLGIGEQDDNAGTAGHAPARDAVLAAAQTLIDRGARCLVVALASAERDATAERQVRDWIKGEYPRDYLGSVPVFLSSDLAPRPGYVLRMNTAVLNAYIHAKLARLLYQAGEDLRRLHYAGTLFIGHNTGTVARVARTRAIHTYNSGPAAGLLGARAIGRLYGAGHVITTDMGGTSFDIGHVVAGTPGYALDPEVEGIQCGLPMLAIRAFGAGGGSIARVRGGALAVGPESSGAVPGPACFGLGGTEPTLTDANLVLGALDPDYFLGGGMGLDPERARAAIGAAVAAPLATGIEDAALRIRDCVEAAMGREVAAVRNLFPAAADPMLIAYGGAGGLHACAIAAHGGIRRIVVTPFCAVSSAFGSSLLDAGHLYYRRIEAPLGNGTADRELASAIAAMRREAGRDLHGEGFDPAQIEHRVQLFLRAPDGSETVLEAEASALETGGLGAVSGGIGAADASWVLATAALLASAPVPHFALAPVARSERDLADALRGHRSVYIDSATARADVPVYDRERLGHGHEFDGPALVESAQTTLFVPAGWHLHIDRYLNALLQHGSGSGRSHLH